MKNIKVAEIIPAFANTKPINTIRPAKYNYYTIPKSSSLSVREYKRIKPNSVKSNRQESKLIKESQNLRISPKIPSRIIQIPQHMMCIETPQFSSKLPELVKNFNLNIIFSNQNQKERESSLNQLREGNYAQQSTNNKIIKKHIAEELKFSKVQLASKLNDDNGLCNNKIIVNEPKEIAIISKASTTPVLPKCNKNFIAHNIIQKRADLTDITDLSLWKKKQQLDDSTKVYIVLGKYYDLRQALKDRGWIENTQHNSVCFDFKWSTRIDRIDYKSLLDFQLVNHFENCSLLTTKIGLCKNLKNLMMYNNVNINKFYPRSFDLSDISDMADFISEFKITKAECILKKFMASDYNILQLDEERLLIALNICEKRVKDIDEALDDGNTNSELVTDNEWKILSNDELSYEGLAKKKHANWFKRVFKKFGPFKNKCRFKRKIFEKPKLDVKVNANDNKISEATNLKIKNYEHIKARVANVLEKLKQISPQYELNKFKNIWIIKPAGMSRGRGIKIFNNLTEIQDYSKYREQQYIVQKYIENPMIILNRKYDIRQWVLITGWSGITIWIYSECYIRFGAVEYNDAKLTNRYMHLTNNCVTKHFSGPEGDIEGNMWDQDEYSEYLKEYFGRNVFEEQIKPMIQKIIIWSLESVQDTMINRQRSCELLGYDFMVDEDCNPWLLEVNSSPAMDYSTVTIVKKQAITKRLVKDVSEDIIKVTIDYYGASKKKRPEIDTGKFVILKKGNKAIDSFTPSYGINLVCEGKRFKP